jgi:uncharacterized membrane protein
MIRLPFQQSKKSLSGLALTCLLLALTGCYYDSEEALYYLTPVDCTTIPATFDANVQAILNSKCAISGCHDATASGGTILLTFSNAKLKADRIKQRAVVEKTMPPSGGITINEINTLKCWIANGTPQ